MLQHSMNYYPQAHHKSLLFRSLAVKIASLYGEVSVVKGLGAARFYQNFGSIKTQLRLV